MEFRGGLVSTTDPHEIARKPREDFPYIITEKLRSPSNLVVPWVLMLQGKKVSFTRSIALRFIFGETERTSLRNIRTKHEGLKRLRSREISCLGKCILIGTGAIFSDTIASIEKYFTATPASSFDYSSISKRLGDRRLNYLSSDTLGVV